MSTASDFPYRGRLVACDLCGRLGTRSDIRPSLLYFHGSPERYEPVVRCVDRRGCEATVDEAARREMREAVLAP